MCLDAEGQSSAVSSRTAFRKVISEGPRLSLNFSFSIWDMKTALDDV